MEKFSAVLGLTWRAMPSMTATFHTADGEELTDPDGRVVYSVEGPPYVELMQAHGDELFALRGGERVHHLGIWAPDYESYRADDSGDRLPIERTIHVRPGDPFQWLSDPADLFGVRIEFTDEARRPGLQPFLDGGPLFSGEGR